nr:hypothetical protein [Candidatus Sigynarchaeota archaeon]
LELGQALVDIMMNDADQKGWNFSVEWNIFKEIFNQVKNKEAFSDFFKLKMVEKESLLGSVRSDKPWSKIDNEGRELRPCFAILSSAEDHAIRFYANLRSKASLDSECLLKLLNFDEPGYLSTWPDHDSRMDVEFQRVHFLGCLIPTEPQVTSEINHPQVKFIALSDKIAGIQLEMTAGSAMIYIIPQSYKKSMSLRRFLNNQSEGSRNDQVDQQHDTGCFFFTDDSSYPVNSRELIEHLDKYIDIEEWELRKVMQSRWDFTFRYYLVSRKAAVSRFPNIHTCISLDDGTFSLYDMNNNRRLSIVHCRHLVLQGDRVLPFQALPLVQSIIATANTWSQGNYDAFSPRIMVDSIPVQPSSGKLLEEILQELMLYVRDSYDVYKRAYYLGYVIYAFRKIVDVDRVTREIKDRRLKYRDSQGYAFMSSDENFRNSRESLRISKTHGAPDDVDGISGGSTIDDHTGTTSGFEYLPAQFFEERQFAGTIARECCALMNRFVLHDAELFIDSFANFLVMKADMTQAFDFGTEWVFVVGEFEKPLIDTILVDAELASCFYEKKTIDADRACAELARGDVSMAMPFLLCVYSEMDHVLSSIVRFRKLYHDRRIGNIYDELVATRGTAHRWEKVRCAMQDRACKTIRDRLAILTSYLDVVDVATRSQMLDEIKHAWPILLLPFMILLDDLIRLQKEEMTLQVGRIVTALKSMCSRILGEKISKILESPRSRDLD